MEKPTTKTPTAVLHWGVRGLRLESSQTTNNETTEPKSTNVCGHLLGSNDQKVKWEVLRQKAKLRKIKGTDQSDRLKLSSKGL